MPEVEDGLLSVVHQHATLLAVRNRHFWGKVVRRESFCQSLEADVIYSPDNCSTSTY